MFKYILIALVALFVAAPAWAETCTCSDISPNMIAQDTGSIWAGCTPDSTDDYVVAAGCVLEITADVEMADLSQTGGDLGLSGSITASHATANFSFTGGTFRPQGKVVYEGRAESFTWAATNDSHTMEIPGDVGDITAGATTAASGDFIVFTHDLPGDASNLPSLLQRLDPVQLTDGPPEPGMYRPAFMRHRWFPITVASGTTVTFAIDEWELPLANGGFEQAYPTYSAPGSVAFMGSRLPLLNVNPTAVALNLRGVTTDLTVPTGTTADFDSDFGGWYVRFDTNCTETNYKIVHTIDGAGGSDTIRIAGDPVKDGCTDADNFDITPGGRAGDPFVVVRPAQLIGNQQAAVMIDFSAATIVGEWFRFVDLDFVASDAFSTYSGNNCNVCFFNTDTTTNTATGSSMRGFDIAFTKTHTSDTSTVGVINTTGAGTGDEPLGGTLADMSGLIFSDYYIHDQINAEPTVGNHAIFHRAPGGFVAVRGRHARTGDDLYGGQLMSQGTTQKSWQSAYQLILVEQMPDDNNSDSCIDITNEGTGTYFDVVPMHIQNAGSVHYDLFAMGCGTRAVTGGGLGVRFPGLVWGGGGNAEAGTTNSSQLSIAINEPACGALCAPVPNTPTAYDLTVDYFNSPTYANGISNCIGFNDGDTATGTLLVGGYIKDCFVVSETGSTLGTVATIERSFLDMGTPSADAFWESSGAVEGPTAISVTDSVLLRVDAVKFLDASLKSATGIGGTGDLSFTVIRSAFGAGTINAANGLTNSGLSAEEQTTTVNGIVVSAITPGAGGMGSLDTPSSTNDGTRVTNACIDATSTVDDDGGNSAYGPSRTASSYHKDAAPDSDDQSNARAWLTKGSGGCSGNLPREFGPDELRPSHALLGTGFLRILDRVSSHDIGKARSVVVKTKHW